MNIDDGIIRLRHAYHPDHIDHPEEVYEGGVVSFVNDREFQHDMTAYFTGGYHGLNVTDETWDRSQQAIATAAQQLADVVEQEDPASTGHTWELYFALVRYEHSTRG